MILSIVAIVLAVSALVYCGHVAVVFQRFNDGIREWSVSLDESARDAIERSARNILKELDEKISESENSSVSEVEDGSLNSDCDEEK